MNKLKVTDYNTIIGDDFEEMPLNDFIETIENKYGDSYAIYYEQNNNIFKVIYDSKEYYLILDDTIMNDYVIGNYNPLTSKIRQIIDTVDLKKEKALKKSKIIKDAENGLIPNDEARQIYLEYLLENKKILNRIKKYFTNLHFDFMESSKFLDEYHESTKIRYIKATWSLFLLFLVVIIFIFSKTFSLKFVYLFCFKKRLVSAIRLLGNLSKKRFSRLINSRDNTKMLNYKIKQLKIDLQNNKLKLKDNYEESMRTFEKVQTDSFDDPIMKNINDIIVDLKNINPTDREVLSRQIEEILNEYRDRFNNIQNQLDDDVLTLGEDNLFALQSDIISKISLLEMRINDIKEKDLNLTEMQAEYLKLKTKLKQTKVRKNNYKYTPSNIGTKNMISNLKQNKPLCKSRRRITGYYK